MKIGLTDDQPIRKNITNISLIRNQGEGRSKTTETARSNNQIRIKICIPCHASFNKIDKPRIVVEYCELKKALSYTFLFPVWKTN